jgi:hypothetical protein
MVSPRPDGHPPALDEAGSGLTGHELDRLARAARLARDAELVAPPESVWDAIAAEVDAEEDDGAAESPGGGPDAPGGEAGRHPGSPGAPGPAETAPSGAYGTVTPLDGRRPRRGALRWLAVAAVLVVLGGLGAVVLARGGAQGSLVAEVALDDLVGPGGPSRRPATAEVRRVEDRLELMVTMDLEPPPAGHYYELWVIDRTVTRLISLGPVRPDGVYTLPGGLALGEFPVVDVSLEPFDGDTTHSGDSILRGVLPV